MVTRQQGLDPISRLVRFIGQRSFARILRDWPRRGFLCIPGTRRFQRGREQFRWRAAGSTRNHLTLQVGLFMMVWALAFPASANNDGPLQLTQTIPLPEVDGRIDHFSIDVKGRRAFLAALAKNTIEVVDLKAGRVTQTLPEFAKPQGVLFVPELNKLFVASGADGTLKILDGTSLAVLSTSQVSLGADAIGYDPRTSEVYVGSGGGDANKELGDLTVFSATTGAQVAALTADAHVGGSLIESRGERVFVLVPEKAQVVVLDRKTRAQVVKWTVPGIQKNVALDLDERSHRLFLGVRTPASIVVLNSDSGAVVASVPTVATLDGLCFDAVTRRIYTTGGEGFVDVTQQIDADHYERIAHIPTGPTARTSVFVSKWRKLYVAVPRDKERSAELRIFDVAR
jgi:DNA-binding beta-propeller fold protein YncE